MSAVPLRSQPKSSPFCGSYRRATFDRRQRTIAPKPGQRGDHGSLSLDHSAERSILVQREMRRIAFPVPTRKFPVSLRRGNLAVAHWDLKFPAKQGKEDEYSRIRPPETIALDRQKAASPGALALCRLTPTWAERHAQRAEPGGTARGRVGFHFAQSHFRLCALHFRLVE